MMMFCKKYATKIHFYLRNLPDISHKDENKNFRYKILSFQWAKTWKLFLFSLTMVNRKKYLNLLVSIEIFLYRNFSLEEKILKLFYRK